MSGQSGSGHIRHAEALYSCVKERFGDSVRQEIVEVFPEKNRLSPAWSIFTGRWSGCFPGSGGFYFTPRTIAWHTARYHF